MTEIERGVTLYDALYTPEVVMARVSHLGYDQQREVERITRILRARFDPGAMIEPRPRITQVLLAPPKTLTGKRPPDFEFWVIVSDRLFARQSLWRSVRQEIDQALGRMARGDSSPSTYWLKIGAKTHDAFTPQRLAKGITLYRARDDDPLRRCPSSRANEWAAALAAYDEADAAWLPAQANFHTTERVYFARRKGLSKEDRRTLCRLIGYDQVIADEQRCHDARHHAVITLLNMPAPDCAAIIRKLELLTDGNPDAGAEHLLLADLRRLVLSGSGDGGSA